MKRLSLFKILGVSLFSSLSKNIKTRNPQVAMINFLEKLRSQSSPPRFLSTHQATGDRIARFQETMDSSSANS